jgi:hypothetical protein
MMWYCSLVIVFLAFTVPCLYESVASVNRAPVASNQRRSQTNNPSIDNSPALHIDFTFVEPHVQEITLQL